MKIKFTKVIPVILVATMLLSGCGSAMYENGASVDYSHPSSNSYSSSKDMSGMSFDVVATAGSSSADGGSYDSASYEEAMPSEETALNSSDESVLEGAKLIRDVYINMETTSLDSLVEEMSKRTSNLGGYIQDVDLYNYTYSRSYSMIIRIPYSKVDSFMDGIEEFGTVKNISDSTRDITLQYADSETRLKNLNQQHERLLNLLEKAENLTDVIEIEARLSEVETEIDSYTLQIKNYDNLVNYSTISLNIEERDYVSANVDNSLWGRITSGLSDNLHELKEGFFDLIVWFVVHIPNILIWIVVIFFIIVVFKKIKKKPIKFLKFKKRNKKDKDSANEE